MVSLIGAGAILLTCLIVPRGFCGYLCPLGATFDLLDSTLGRAFGKPRRVKRRWWVHLRYLILAVVLISACLGVMWSEA